MENIRTGEIQGLKDSRTGEIKKWRIQGLEESRSEGIWNWETKDFRNPRTIEILDFRKSKLKY